MHESNDFIFLVMDQMEGGTLATLLQHKGRLCEKDAAIVMKGLFSGLKYIHSYGYIHRDIKPDNVLLLRDNDYSSVQIADFGLGMKMGLGVSQENNIRCGTVIYMSPEQATTNNYSMHVDVWACGIILYTLLTGQHPLFKQNDTQEEYINKILKPTWVFPDGFGELAKDLFLHCCCINTVHRYDAMNALQHPWITRYARNVEIPMIRFQNLH